ncbi:hypothetical protein HYC85_031645, partial [Camellia sinensis]
KTGENKERGKGSAAAAVVAVAVAIGVQGDEEEEPPPPPQAIRLRFYLFQSPHFFCNQLFPTTQSSFSTICLEMKLKQLPLLGRPLEFLLVLIGLWLEESHYLDFQFMSEEMFLEDLQKFRRHNLVTAHISSISIIFVHDGAIGSSPKCDAKVRIISDSPSAVLSLSSVLWRTPTRAVSHDSCPLTIYVATSISPSAGDVLGLGAQGNNDFIAADVERSSLILCGKAFTDAKGTKEALAALSGPIITSRGGLPLSAGLLVSGESVILLFASEDTIQSCSDMLVSGDPGVVLSSEGASPLFHNGNCVGSYLSKLPAAVIFVSSDSSGTIPSASKLSPGQAAYHFLAGYQNGKFMPAYSLCPSAVDPLELAKVFLSKIKDDQIPSFLINISEGEKQISGGHLHKKYKSFLSTKFQQLPEEFSF